MNFKLSPTELQIVDILTAQRGHIKTAQLVKLYKKKRPKTPKQTVYRAIAGLKKKEVVVVAKGITSANTHWIGVLRQKLDVLESHSLNQMIPDKVTYTFPSLLSLAPVWTHHVNVLTEQASIDKPIVFINPHQWFYAVREWSENQLVDSIEEEGRTLWQGINYNSAVDKTILKNKFTGRPNIHGSFITPKPGEKDLYVNVIGDYIIKVSTTAEFASAINAAYSKADNIDADFISELEDLIAHSGPAKIIIAKRKSQADMYRNLMKKFVV